MVTIKISKTEIQIFIDGMKAAHTLRDSQAITIEGYVNIINKIVDRMSKVLEAQLEKQSESEEI